MGDDAVRPPPSAMDQPPSVVSPDSASHRPAQQDAAADTSTPASSSRMSTAFEFASGPPDDAVPPSFDPAIAAFADMSFTRPAVPSPYLRDKASQPPQQPDCFQRADVHDKKRIKVDPATPALDSIDYWALFDDDGDKMGSFEIDYSRRNDAAGLNGATSIMPGLGSGLYSTAMAPFRAEDFIDDTAFDQGLSDDEDMLDTTPLGGDPPADAQPADAQGRPGPPLHPSLPARPTLRPPQPPPPPQLPTPSWDRPAMRRDVWDALPRGPNRVLSPDEQRRLLEIALNTGRMPGSFIPPTGFGIGFGAGLGARPPTEFERRAATSTQHSTSAAAVPPQADHRQHSKRPAPPKSAPPRKPSETGKPKSADRIAHNDVERKYRTNLKVKIAELRDAVPSLQPQASGNAEQQGGGPKVSKGTVLTKAAEYIQQLEQRNKAIMLEHQQLARRLQAFETLFNGAGRPDLMPNHSMTLFDPRGFC